MNEDILEKLAELEHEQWCQWASVLSKELSSLLEIIEKSGEELSDEDYEFAVSVRDRLIRWENLMIPYSDLSEEEKEKDRVYARKILSVFEKDL